MTVPPRVEVKAVLQAIRDGKTSLEDRPILVLLTEAHLLPRIVGRFPNVLRLDFTDVKAKTPNHFRRLSATRLAARRFVRDIPSEDAIVIVDTSEGWLVSSLARFVAETLPNLTLIGMQHGVMPVTGWRSRRAVRRLQATVTDAQHMLLNGTMIGAGFGNSPFSGMVTMGRIYSEYVRDFNPQIDVLDDFEFVTGAEGPLASVGADVIFVDQVLEVYIEDAARVRRDIVNRLAELSSELGIKVLFRPHPSGPQDAKLCQSIEVVSGGSLWSGAAGSTVFVSYFSTGLLEAFYAGNHIVSVRIPGVPQRAYDSFLGVVELEDFLTKWTLDRFSAVNVGFITERDNQKISQRNDTAL